MEIKLLSDMMGTKSMVGSKDDELSMKPAAALYPSRLSPIRPSLLEPSREGTPLNSSLSNRTEPLREA